MKAVFLDRGSFPQHIQVQLPAQVTEVVEFDNTKAEDVIQRIAGAAIVLTNKVLITAETIKQTPSLQLIQVMATGTNNIDMGACEEQNVTVQNVAGYSTISVPEHTFSMLLALRRNLFSYVDDVKAGKWATSEFFCFIDYPIKDLSGSTMTIIGAGSLGQKIADIAKAFGMQVIFAERKNATQVRTGYTAFATALKKADVISINCPLTNETHNLMSDEEFAVIKPSALLLNISRGGIVDEHALVTAFQNKHIAGAAFDVATQEPMPLDHPLHTLAQYPNFLLTPHVAWASNEAMQTLVDIAMEKIAAFIDNQ